MAQKSKSTTTTSGAHKAQIMKLVEAAYEEGSFSRVEGQIADPKGGTAVSNEVSFTFTFNDANARMRQLYNLAKKLGV